MKTFRIFGAALMALALTMSSCENDNNKENTPTDPYKDYPQLIVGKWFRFTPESSIFMTYEADGAFYQIGYGESNGWRERIGTYQINDNSLIRDYIYAGRNENKTDEFEVTNEKLTLKRDGNTGDFVHYRVKESFDIKGNYSYLNSVARVVPAEGKTALQLPDGVTFNGQNSISIDAMHGDRIIDVMKKFFADATFAADGKLNHTMDAEAKVKNYTLNGNNLTFDLYEGGSYKVNATTFPDEDGDRLFIIIPKQAAWLGGMVDLVEKENEGLKLDAAQIAALEKEFMDTFETFTVILSLSKK